MKKIIAVVLALMMMVSMLPVSYAAESDVGITWDLAGIRVPEQKSVLAGEDLDITLEAEEGFALPDDVEIEGIEEDTYFFSSTSGRLFVGADAILGDLTVKAEAVAVQAPESPSPEGEGTEGDAETDPEDEDCECASSQNMINSAEAEDIPAAVAASLSENTSINGFTPVGSVPGEYVTAGGSGYYGVGDATTGKLHEFTYVTATSNDPAVSTEFAGGGKTVTATVYTPPGYNAADKSTAYNVLVVEGGPGDDGHTMLNGSEFVFAAMLDKMINEKLIKPIIVVELNTSQYYQTAINCSSAGNCNTALENAATEIGRMWGRDVLTVISYVNQNFNTYGNPELNVCECAGVELRDHYSFYGMSQGGAYTAKIMTQTYNSVSWFTAANYGGSSSDVSTLAEIMNSNPGKLNGLYIFTTMESASGSYGSSTDYGRGYQFAGYLFNALDEENPDRGYILRQTNAYSHSIPGGNTAFYNSVQMFFPRSECDCGVPITITKRSADPSITNGNSYYSLEGAVYGIYSDAGCTRLLGRMTTDASGVAKSAELYTPGPYYIKEIKAPKGYALDTKVHSVQLAASGDLSGDTTFTDIPTTDPVSILLRKCDENHQDEEAITSGNMSLAGAQFTIKFYGNLFDTADKAEASGAPLRTWVMRTNANGFSYLSDDYKVSGDPFWIVNDIITLPVGTIVIQETLAPTGYLINPDKYVVQITEDGASTPTVSTYNAPIIPEPTISGGIKARKVDSQTVSVQGDATLAGAEFTIYNNNKKNVTVKGVEYAPNAAVLTIISDASGVATSGARDLPYGSYIIKETKAPNGHKLNANWSYEFSITEDGVIKDAGDCSDDIIRGGLSVQKKDLALDTTTPYGDASFKDIVLGVYNASAHNVVVNGTTYAPGAKVMEIKTDATGYASTGDQVLPFGTYKVKELSVPAGNGYGVNTSYEETVEIRKSGIEPPVACKNTGNLFGGISVQKWDPDLDAAAPQGNATLEGAVFAIVNRSANPVVVDGKTYNVGDEVMRITAGADGKASSGAVLPMGTYEITEVVPPVGYKLNTTWKETVQIRENGKIYALDGAHACEEPVIRGGLSVQKVDSESGETPQGDGSFEGIVFNIKNVSEHPVKVNGVIYAPNEIVGTITTNASGFATTAANFLPYGTYEVTEKSVPANSGYLVNTAWKETVKIELEGKIVPTSVPATNTIKHGGVITAKYDADLLEGVAQGDATLAGAEIQVINISEHPVYVNGVEYAVGEVVYTFTTKEDGTVDTAGMVFPYGSYQLKESKPPAGYKHNETWAPEFTIREDGVTVDKSDVANGVHDDVIRGSITVQKRDKETGDTTPLGGGTFAGVQIQIVNVSEKAIEYKGKIIEVGEVVDVIISGEDGIATTGPNVLPYGTYELTEVVSPKGYLLNPDWIETVEVREEKDYLLDGDTALVNQVIRGDFNFVKVNGNTMERIKNAVFRVTSKTTGESHIIVTDVNGNFYSSADVNPHTQNTNGNDAAVDGDTVDESALDPEAGIWFNGGNDKAKPDNQLGAVPFDTYVFEELRTSANMGLELVTFEIVVYKDGFDINIGTVDDNGPTAPSISTILLDKDTQLHLSTPAMDVVLVDEVRYFNTIKGDKYTVSGVLVDRDTGENILVDGEPVTATKEFKATGEGGSVNLTFRLNATDLAGHSVVAFVTLLQNGKELFVHDNLYNEDETVHFPKIGTTATGVDGDKEIAQAENAVVIDVVSYSNLEPDVTYVVKGQMMDKATGLAARDSSGALITAETTFKPTSENGTVEVRFDFDASRMGGMVLVAYEYVLRGKVTVASHEDIDDVDQTISIPAIKTTLTSEDGTHLALADGTITLTDTIDYDGLVVGKTYTAIGTLINKATGEPLLDDNGEEITATTSFVAEASSGTVEVTFTFSGVSLAGTTIVAFEKLDNGSFICAVHEDPDDEDQTVHIPELSTTASGKNGEKMFFAKGSVTIIDTVEYDNLKAGESYTIKGYQVDAATGEALLVNGERVTAEKTFKARKTSGSEQLSFTFDASDLEGKVLVTFESLYYGDTLIGKHEDLNDADQTVMFPRLRTFASDDNGQKEILAGEDVKIVDSVEYENLEIGYTYKLVATLVDAASGEALRDAEGNIISAEQVLENLSASNGTAQVEFTFNGRNLAGVTAVVFEELFLDKTKIGEHKDLSDADQTVTFPKIRTKLTDQNDGEGRHVINSESDSTVYDVVYYENVVPGQTYTLYGKVVDRNDQNVVLAEASATFAAAAANGSEVVEFHVEGGKIVSNAIVAFEELHNAAGIVAEHKDLDDSAQTVYVPHVSTSLHDGKENKEINIADVVDASGEFVEIVDRVSYDGLAPSDPTDGPVYSLHAALVDKATGETIYRATKQLTVDSASGTVDMVFRVPVDDVLGKTLVCYEQVWLNGAILCRHEDIDDENQTVTFPEISTSLVDAEHENRIAIPSKEMEIIDRVYYAGLIPGKEYTLIGKLMLKSTGKALKDSNGDPIVNTVTFTADDSGEGYVDVPFTIDGELLAGKTVVAFETLYREGRELFVHADIEDEDQSIHIPTIATTATGEDGKSKVITVEDGVSDFTIMDRIEYKNLIPGETYKVSGVLMNKEDGSVIKNADGEAFVSEVEFTPDTADGFVDVKFVIDANIIGGKTIVVFETLLYGPTTIARHEDINDEAQTVKISYRNKFFKYDASTREGLAGAVFEVRDLAAKKGTPPQVVTSGEDGFAYFNAQAGHEYSVIETKAPDGYQSSEGVEYFITVDENGVLGGDIDIANIRGGTVVINKVDVVTGDPVPGCEITVYRVTQVIDEEATKKAIEEAAKAKNVKLEDFHDEVPPVMKDVYEKVFVQETDENGRIYFFADEPGVFAYKETKTVDGFYLNDDEYRFEIAKDLTVSGSVRFVNVPFGTAVIKKLDKAGNPLKGAEIAVYSESGKLLGRGVTGANGRVYFVSPGPGKYYFVETKAPEGYVKTDEKFWFTIGDDYTITGTTSIVNERTPSTSTKTGDSENLGFLVVAACVSGFGVACCVVGLAVTVKKGKKKDEA